MKILAIVPGRFHPFHPGHAASFWEMASLFGVENTMLAISMKQEAPRSPFSPFDRAKMAMSLGIPKENIMLIKQPYSTKEYAEKLKKQDIDPNETAIVFGVSQKDMEEDPRFDFEPLQDGSPSFYQPYQEGELANMLTHGYVMSTRTVPFKIAGHTIKDASDIRTMYSKGNSNVKNRVLADLYGFRAAKVLKPIFDSSLGLMESIKAYYDQIKTRLVEADSGQKQKFAKILSEAKEDFDTSKVWYHGTTSPTDFKQFKIGKGGVDELGKGIYVTSDPEMAEAWAGRSGAGGRIMPLYVRKGELIDSRLVTDSFIKSTIIPRLKQIYPPESPEYKVHMAARKLHETKPFSEWTPEDKELYNKGNQIPWLAYLLDSEESLYNYIKNTCKISRNSSELSGINRWLSMVGYVGKYNPNSQIPGQLCVFKPSDLKSAIGNNGKYKGATLVNEEFKDSMIGHHHGQSDMRLSLILDDIEVGYIDYVIYDDEISISMIEVPKDQRRKGYARELLKKLQAEYPDTEIQWGMMTDAGSKLRSQTTYEVPDEEVITKQEKLQRITQKIERLKQFAEKYGKLKNKTDSQYQKFMKVIEPWNELSDEQDDLERELYDKKPTKTFIKK